MAVSFACPQCRSVVKSPRPLPAGQRVKCPKCTHVFPVPAVQKTTPSSQGAPARPPAAFGFDDPAVSGPRRRRSSFAALNVGIFALVLLVGGSGAAAGYFLGNDKAAVALKKGTEPDENRPLDTGRLPETKKTDPDDPPKAEAVNVGTGKEDPLAYVPAESTMLVGADIGAVLKFKPEFAVFLPELLKGGETKLLLDPKKEIGLDPAELFDRILIAVQMDVSKFAGKEPPRPDFVTVIIRSKVPFDQRKVARAVSSVGARKVKDKYIFDVKDPNVTTAYMPSDNILILTNLDGAGLDNLLASDGVKPAVAPEAVELVRKADKAALWMVLPFDATIKKGIESMMPLVVVLPPELQPAVKTAAPETKALGLWLTADPNNAKMSVALRCGNPAHAQQLAGGMMGYWNKMKPGLNQQLAAAMKDVKLPKGVSTLVAGIFASTQAVAAGPIVETSVQLSLPAIEEVVKEASGANGGMLLAGLSQVATKLTEKPFVIDPNEKALLDLVNKARMNNQLPALKVNPKLFELARVHAVAMSKLGAADEEIDEKKNADRLKAAGYKFAKEKALVAVGAGWAAGNTFNSWSTNDGLKETMFDKEYVETGIGFAKDDKNNIYWYQIYVVPEK